MNYVEQKVEKYIEKCGYTWTYDEIMLQYDKWKLGYYISFTAKDVINKCIDDSCRLYG